MKTSWRMAATATLHCLTGCAIGEVLGMVIGTAAALPNAATVALSIVLAFVFGYALTMRGVLKAGLTLAAAIKVALAADTVFGEGVGLRDLTNLDVIRPWLAHDGKRVGG